MSFLPRLLAFKKRRAASAANPVRKQVVPSREITANILRLLLIGGKTIRELAGSATVSKKTVKRVIEAALKVGFEVRISKRGRFKAVLSRRAGGGDAPRDV